MRFSLALLAAALAAPVAIAAPAFAQEQTQAQNDRDNERICRSLPTTASRMGTRERVCMTRAEWRAARRAGGAGDYSASGSTRIDAQGAPPARPVP